MTMSWGHDILKLVAPIHWGKFKFMLPLEHRMANSSCYPDGSWFLCLWNLLMMLLLLLPGGMIKIAFGACRPRIAKYQGQIGKGGVRRQSEKKDDVAFPNKTT